MRKKSTQTLTMIKYQNECSQCVFLSVIMIDWVYKKLEIKKINFFFILWISSQNIKGKFRNKKN